VDCTDKEATKFLPLIASQQHRSLPPRHRGCKNRHAAIQNDDGDPEPESCRATKLMVPAETRDDRRINSWVRAAMMSLISSIRGPQAPVHWDTDR
jgi:hypothetical protein